MGGDYAASDVTQVSFDCHQDHFMQVTSALCGAILSRASNCHKSFVLQDRFGPPPKSRSFPAVMILLFCEKQHRCGCRRITNIF